MKDKTPPIITPSPNCLETKIKPATLDAAATKPIIHRIRRFEIGGMDCSAVTLSESSLIAKHRFYKGLAEISKRGRDFVQNFSNHSLFLKICDVRRKNWKNPIAAPTTIPPTIPHGELPKIKSANQPMINIKTTEPNNVIAAA